MKPATFIYRLMAAVLILLAINATTFLDSLTEGGEHVDRFILLLIMIFGAWGLAVRFFTMSNEVQEPVEEHVLVLTPEEQARAEEEFDAQAESELNAYESMYC